MASHPQPPYTPQCHWLDTVSSELCAIPTLKSLMHVANYFIIFIVWSSLSFFIEWWLQFLNNAARSSWGLSFEIHVSSSKLQSVLSSSETWNIITNRNPAFRCRKLSCISNKTKTRVMNKTFLILFLISSVLIAFIDIALFHFDIAWVWDLSRTCSAFDDQRLQVLNSRFVDRVQLIVHRGRFHLMELQDCIKLL